MTDVFDLIRNRRSIPRFQPDPVPREVIERMLEAATWAPNHHLTEPWEFYVLEEAAREPFAAIRRDFRRTLFPNPDAPEAQKAAEKIYQTTLATPVIIMVTTQVSADPVLNEDDFAATFCAIQNMLLVAASRGIGTYLRTGGLVRDPTLRAFLDLDEDRRAVGILYVGYPAVVPERRRTPYQQKTHWLATAPLARTGEARASGSPSTLEAQSPEQGIAIDPVCKMEVDVATAVYRSEYDGVTYYFCAPGCKRGFDANPAAYVTRP